MTKSLCKQFQICTLCYLHFCKGVVTLSSWHSSKNFDTSSFHVPNFKKISDKIACDCGGYCRKEKSLEVNNIPVVFMLDFQNHNVEYVEDEYMIVANTWNM